MNSSSLYFFDLLKLKILYDKIRPFKEERGIYEESILFVFVLCSLICFNISTCHAHDLSIYDYLYDYKICFENGEFIIYSNYNYQESEMMKVINSSNKECIFFNIDSNSKCKTNLFGEINGSYFSYKVNSDIKTYDFKQLKELCNNYFIEIVSKPLETSTIDENNDDFNKYSKNLIVREQKVPYGYIDVQFKFYYSKNNIKNAGLVIVEANSSYVCGSMTNSNNSNYDKKYYQYSQYAHLSVDNFTEWEDSTRDYRTTVVSEIKDFWPVNEPMTQTISSSFSAGATYGYSYNNGFSTSAGLSVGTNNNYGLNIGFNYSKSYTTSLPALSVQRNASDSNIIEWTYDYDKQWIGSRINTTNNAKQYILFEVNGKDCNRTDFVLNYEFEATYAERNGLGFRLGTRELIFSSSKSINSLYL